jgi:hypothetical protein
MSIPVSRVPKTGGNIMGFIYRADVYCQPCGEAICTRLTSQGLAPANPDNERTFDSDDFPKHADVNNEESDTPHHCAACSQFLHNPLTPDGYKYVLEILGDEPGDVALEWADYYGFSRDDVEVWHSGEMTA